MKIKSIGSNQTEITLSNGTVVFVSYDTPVAAFIPGTGIVRTDCRWSNTTTRHINKWIASVAPSATVSTREQSFFDALV